MKNSTDSSPVPESEKREWLAWAAELKPAFAAAEPVLLAFDRNLTIDQRFDLLTERLRWMQRMGIAPPDDLLRPWTHADRFLT